MGSKSFDIPLRGAGSSDVGFERRRSTVLVKLSDPGVCGLWVRAASCDAKTVLLDGGLFSPLLPVQRIVRELLLRSTFCIALLSFANGI